MDLHLTREPSAFSSTHGRLSIDGVFECFTLEDVIREQPGVAVAAWKVPGKTAIPAGRYRWRLVRSPRFQRVLPRLEAVPGYEGILIHAGNDHSHTDGCILVGQDRNGTAITGSRVALERLIGKMQAGGGAGWITIENPPAITGPDVRAA